MKLYFLFSSLEEIYKNYRGKKINFKVYYDILDKRE